jgi:hypothetical protein
MCIADRELDRMEVEATLNQPEATMPDPPGREILMRRYFDRALQQEMLLRVVVEEAPTERVVVTAYKTSQIGRYLKGPAA